MKCSLRAIGVIIGILLIVSPVFGESIVTETMNLDIDDAYTDSNIYELEGTTEHNTKPRLRLFVRNVEELRAPFTLILHTNMQTDEGVEYADYMSIALKL